MPYYPPASTVVAGNGITVSGSTVSLNTNNGLGVGSTIFGYVTSTTANNATIAGASVGTILGDAAVGTIGQSSAVLTGTWRNITGATLTAGGNDGGMLIRTV